MQQQTCSSNRWSVKTILLHVLILSMRRMRILLRRNNFQEIFLNRNRAGQTGAVFCFATEREMVNHGLFLCAKFNHGDTAHCLSVSHVGTATLRFLRAGSANRFAIVLFFTTENFECFSLRFTGKYIDEHSVNSVKYLCDSLW